MWRRAAAWTLALALVGFPTTIAVLVALRFLAGLAGADRSFAVPVAVLAGAALAVVVGRLLARQMDPR